MMVMSDRPEPTGWIVAGVDESYGPFATKAEAQRAKDQLGWVYSWARLTPLFAPASLPKPRQHYPVGSAVMVEWGGRSYGPGVVVAVDGAVCTVECRGPSWPSATGSGPVPVDVHEDRLRAPYLAWQ